MSFVTFDPVPAAISSAAQTVADAVQSSSSFEWTLESGITLALAIIGTVLSIVSLIEQSVHNRQNLTCEVHAWHTFLDAEQKFRIVYISLTFANRSREQIAITGVAIRTGEGGHMFEVMPIELLGDGSVHALSFPVNLSGLEAAGGILYGKFFPVVWSGQPGKLAVRIFTTKKPVDMSLELNSLNAVSLEGVLSDKR